MGEEQDPPSGRAWRNPEGVSRPPHILTPGVHEKPTDGPGVSPVLYASVRRKTQILAKKRDIKKERRRIVCPPRFWGHCDFVLLRVVETPQCSSSAEWFSGGGGFRRACGVQIWERQAGEHQFRGLGGRLGTFTTFVVDVDILSLLRKGALEALNGKLDTPGSCLHLGKLDEQVPLRPNAAVEVRPFWKGRRSSSDGSGHAV